MGCGIAGASLAYFLTVQGMTDILILEREEQPGYHATGRSASVLSELEQIPSVSRLKALASEFLRNPPDNFCGYPLLKHSGILTLFQEPAWNGIRELLPVWKSRGVKMQLLSATDVTDLIPVVSRKHFDSAVLLPENGHIDVHELLSGYLNHARRNGAELRLNVEVQGVAVEHGRCTGVITSAEKFNAPIVVNAAGAWAGIISKLAGAAQIELTPKRRTIITFDSPSGIDVSEWPLIVDYSNRLYFSPESGGLLASSMDEDPVEPCDARPDYITVAKTIDKIEKLTPRLVPQTIRSKWAGLRTFAPDQVFVAGEDPLIRGFFWLAGQGGAGISTSPIIGEISADLIVNGRTDKFDTDVISPARFFEE